MNITDEITEFLEFIIESTMTYRIDDEKYIINIDNDNRIKIDDNGKKKHIKLLTIPFDSSDDIILNPFNEVINESIDKKWLYIVLNMSLYMKLKQIFNTIINLHDIQNDLTISQIKSFSKIAAFSKNENSQ